MPTPTITSDSLIKPTDLRGILKYVPMFSDQVFVIALDGSLIAHDNFQNVLLDIAVLRSLNIKVVLAYGIGHQIQSASKLKDIEISDSHGEGATDNTTLTLAMEIAGEVGSLITQGLTRSNLRCASCNGVRAKSIGIEKGIDQINSGDVDKLDLKLFNQLLSSQTTPIVSPIAYDRNGRPLRINSDLLASELAAKIEATKLIYMTTETGIREKGQTLKNLPVDELELYLKNNSKLIKERLISKARYSAKAVRMGTPRAHILDGRIFGALLNEVFDKVGIGTMIYSDEYQSIRPAHKKDAQSIYNITRNAVRSETLFNRSLKHIINEINNYLVYEIDGSIIGCMHLRKYSNSSIIEIGSVYVQSFYQGKGVGKKLIKYAIKLAHLDGTKKLFAMTTKASDFFEKVCNFKEGKIEDLPLIRQEEHHTNCRNSKVFYYLIN
ncbi:MAG: amino-acid N-acetyltransferase [Puniceicoccaceae bacterium]|nr:amino-acid N-acetyltransferase [Puniceicoccaceae bacterium]